MTTPSPVRVDAFLADDLAMQEGKLQIAGGGWTHLLVRDLPSRRERIGLAVMLRVPIGDGAATYALSVRLEDPAGRVLTLGSGEHATERLEGQITAHPPAPGSPLSEDVVPIAIAVDSLLLERTGAYRFIIAVDGIDAKIVPFAVLQAPAEDAT